MPSFFWGMAVVLLLALIAGLVRIARGPSLADRMMSAQLFGTTGTAILLVLSQAMGLGALCDVALVLAVLAPLVSITFVRTVWLPRGR